MFSKNRNKGYLTTSTTLGAIALTVDSLIAIGNAILGSFLHQQRPVQLLGNLLHLILPASSQPNNEECYITFMPGNAEYLLSVSQPRILPWCCAQRMKLPAVSASLYRVLEN